jgi:hypothetical protein
LKLGQGREKAKLYLEEHPELAAKLEEAVKDRLLGAAPELSDEVEEEEVDDNEPRVEKE